MTKDAKLNQLVDRERLREYLSEHLGETGHFEIEYHQEGHSNETLFIIWGNRDFVLRRPPFGETAESAHDVIREYRVLSALQPTSIPVPEPILKCQDQSVIGCDFYLMERLEGQVIRTDEPQQFTTQDYRRELGYRLVGTLAEIHTVDYDSIGLGDFGNPKGYNNRQVERWTKQLEWASTKTGRKVADLYEVGEWLQDHIPKTHTHSLVHGDYRLDNIMLGRDMPPQIIGVLDWEVSSLGDPLMDLGWMLLDWYDTDDREPVIPEWTSPFTRQEGYPKHEELIKKYEERTGIMFEDREFYHVFARFKMATAGEIVYARHNEGNIEGQLPPLMEDRVPLMAERAKEIIEDKG